VATNSENEIPFIGCKDELRQYQIDDHQLIKQYPFNCSIFSQITIVGNKHVFVDLQDGSLHQICIDSQAVFKDNGNIHDEPIDSIIVIRDNKY
jgi:hypothetical protein